jgi:hypothetical protein
VLCILRRILRSENDSRQREEACRYFDEHLREVPGKQLDSGVDFLRRTWLKKWSGAFFISVGTPHGGTDAADLSLRAMDSNGFNSSKTIQVHLLM